MKTHGITDLSLHHCADVRKESRKAAKSQSPAWLRALIVLRLLPVGLALWAVIGCSDDFLDEQQKQSTRESPAVLFLTPATGYYEHTVTIAGLGNRAYSVGLYPKWMVFKYLQGNFTDDVAVLKFTVQNVPASYAPGVYESVLSLTVEDFGIYKIPIRFTVE